MDQVINDPESLHEYRSKLERASEDLENQLQQTDGAIRNVNESGWDDPKFQEFQNNFGEDKDKIKPLSQMIQEYESLLSKLEDKLRAYGDIPMRGGR